MKETLYFLRKNWQFRRVCRKGRKQVTRYAVIFYVKNGLSYTRFGITVSKKVGNSVVRHRVKRLFVEAFRRMPQDIPPGYDLVIIAKRKSAEMDFHSCQKDAGRFLKKLQAQHFVPTSKQ